MRLWLGLMAGLVGPAAAAEWQSLAAIEADEGPWGGAMVPADGPPRDGRPTVALRWQPARAPGPNSPALLQRFDGVEALRFWCHQEAPQPFSLALVLTGRANGYFLASVPLDFAGWRRITVPIAEFRQVRESELAGTTTLGFRAQGYGQPALSPEWVLWIDEVEALPKEGVALPVTNSLELNRGAWQTLAERGNPLLLLNAERFGPVQPAFAPPVPLTSAWQYRNVAEELLARSYAAADAASPLRGRPDLVASSIAAADWLVAALDAEGCWWRRGPLPGDPNVNRFTLGPLLDAALLLRSLPDGEAAWPRWREKLDTAIDLQRRAYRGEVDWDWGGRAAGEYANQDAYFVLVTALSARLYDRPADSALAADMMRRVALNLLPGGGIHYIGVEMESPIYHALNLVIFGRYATLTGDPTAMALLEGTADYWPLVCTAEGYAESWSDVWWKQNWGMPWREAMVIAAGATRDARNQHLLWRVLERSTPSDGGMGAVYAAPYWTGTAPGEAPPDECLVPDENIRGWRGRRGNWYFGVTQGRGLRNTFVGGLVTTPRGTSPLLAAFRGAQIDVITHPQQPNGLFLSQMDDATTLERRGDAALLTARYHPQPRTINGWPTPSTPDTPWLVTQRWLVSGDGIIGSVALEALADAPAVAIVGRLALGPRPPTEQDGEWRCGPLRIALLQRFGEVSAQPVPHYTDPPDRAWPGLELRQGLPDGARAGQRFVYAAWIGPADRQPPAHFDLAPDGGWTATWADGRTARVE